MPAYEILISEKTLEEIIEYYQFLCEHGTEEVGAYFKEQLKKHGSPLPQITINTFARLLIQSKIPKIFAESQVHHDKRDWNLREERILGAVAVHMPVKFFNDGAHSKHNDHHIPLDANLAYVPGALLRSDKTKVTADLQDLVVDGKYDREEFQLRLNALYESRLLPVLFQINKQAADAGKKAAVTVPGIGTGCFAGNHKAIIKEAFRIALEDVLTKHHTKLLHIGIVHYDPYNGDMPQQRGIGHMDYRVCPSSAMTTTAQLVYPKGSSPMTHTLTSLVAWDHFSWPGNDFWPGSRATDDGVKAASTDTMYVITGVEGAYHSQQGSYQPPKGFANWWALVESKNVIFSGPIYVISNEGVKTPLSPVILYPAKKNNELGCKFPSKETRDRFIAALGGAELRFPDTDAFNPRKRCFLTYAEAPDTVYFPGYIAKKGELAVAFLHTEIRDQFIRLLKLPVGTRESEPLSIYPESPLVLYFNLKLLLKKERTLVETYLPACCTDAALKYNTMSRADYNKLSRSELHRFFRSVAEDRQAGLVAETVYSYLTS